MSRSIVVGAGVLVSLALQGCGDGEALTTTVSATVEYPTTTDPYPDLTLVCLEDGPIGKDQCCCSFCGGGLSDDGVLNGTLQFVVYSKKDCLQAGGQCKSVGTSTFQRPPPAKSLHDSELCQRNEGNRFQKHLVGGSPTAIQIVYMSNTSKASVVVREVNSTSQNTKAYEGASRQYTAYENGAGGWNGFRPSDRGTEYADCHYTNASCFYTSEPIHSVEVDGLTAGGAYEYKVDGDDEWVQFKMPPALGEPVVLGFVADLGQTEDSNLTMQHMYEQVNAGGIDAVVYPGDLAYADGAAVYWDSYGRMSEYLFQSVPTAYGVGNHEFNAGGESFGPFLARYAWPESWLQQSTSPLWFSYDTGMAHVIMLCSYCDVSATSPQIAWLQADLKAVDRQNTPWVIASWHTPWYSSNMGHDMNVEGIQMRENFEDTIYKEVDFVVMGHTHAYERTANIYNNAIDKCGPVYITIGDGGNHEGPSCGWKEGEGYEWSERKETSFGYATLSITSATQAEWKWYKNEDSVLSYSDKVTLTRPTSVCGTITV